MLIDWKRAFVWVIGACVALAVSVQTLAESIQFYPPVLAGELNHSVMDEISGMAASRVNPGIMWMHNDHGDAPRVYATDTDGNFRGIYNLIGAANIDWEDMAIGPGPVADTNYIYMGDVGNNDLDRTLSHDPLTVYRVPEPTLPAGSSPFQKNLSGVEAITLTYPVGQTYNSEVIMVDPFSGDLYVVTRQPTTSRVYRASSTDMLDGSATLEFVSFVSIDKPTAGDISADGNKIILRSEDEAYLWQRPEGMPLSTAFSQIAVAVPLADEFNGESLAFSHTGRDYYTTSEGLYAPIYFYQRTFIEGDINADDKVDLLDLVILGENYNQTGKLREHGDLNNDGKVNLVDLVILGSHYGDMRTSVPEPGSMAMFILTAFILKYRRQ